MLWLCPLTAEECSSAWTEPLTCQPAEGHLRFSGAVLLSTQACRLLCVRTPGQSAELWAGRGGGQAWDGAVLGQKESGLQGNPHPPSPSAPWPA